MGGRGGKGVGGGGGLGGGVCVCVCTRTFIGCRSMCEVYSLARALLEVSSSRVFIEWFSMGTTEYQPSVFKGMSGRWRAVT